MLHARCNIDLALNTDSFIDLLPLVKFFEETTSDSSTEIQEQMYILMAKVLIKERKHKEAIDWLLKAHRLSKHNRSANKITIKETILRIWESDLGIRKQRISFMRDY